MASFIVFDVYLIAYFLVWAMVTPLQQVLLPTVTDFASFFYLPHGVRVIATVVMGPRAIPALFLAEVGGNYLFWGLSDPMLLLTVSAVGALIAWVAFEGLSLVGINPYYLNSVDKMPSFTVLLLAGFVASVLNGFALTAILEQGMQIGEVTHVMATFVLGDMTGFLVMILLIKLVLRSLPLSLRD